MCGLSIEHIRRTVNSYKASVDQHLLNDLVHFQSQIRTYSDFYNEFTAYTKNHRDYDLFWGSSKKC